MSLVILQKSISQIVLLNQIWVILLITNPFENEYFEYESDSVNAVAIVQNRYHIANTTLKITEHKMIS